MISLLLPNRSPCLGVPDIHPVGQKQAEYQPADGEGVDLEVNPYRIALIPRCPLVYANHSVNQEHHSNCVDHLKTTECDHAQHNMLQYCMYHYLNHSFLRICSSEICRSCASAWLFSTIMSSRCCSDSAADRAQWLWPRRRGSSYQGRRGRCPESLLPSCL